MDLSIREIVIILLPLQVKFLNDILAILVTFLVTVDGNTYQIDAWTAVGMINNTHYLQTY